MDIQAGAHHRVTGLPATVDEAVVALGHPVALPTGPLQGPPGIETRSSREVGEPGWADAITLRFRGPLLCVVTQKRDHCADSLAATAAMTIGSCWQSGPVEAEDAEHLLWQLIRTEQAASRRGRAHHTTVDGRAHSAIRVEHADLAA
ncbi:hypothetical protein [Amycolatopsis sp. GA6-003]|uniref:hypothetical protein n=1 Tax=Amycolatopsis sp. GA6-003 TaxID=2652444 RepID=UPI00391756EE